MPAEFECPYCGFVSSSPNGTGSDVSCCGEVGHAVKVEEKEVDMPYSGSIEYKH